MLFVPRVFELKLSPCSLNIHAVTSKSIHTCLFGLTVGVIFSPVVQNGQFISNNSMSRMSVHDVNSSLRCQSELTIDSNVTLFTHGCLVGDGNNPVPCGYDDGTSTFGTITRGWSGRRADERNRRVYYLTRSQLSPEEGYYNCHMPHDINPRRGLYILYPSEWPYLMML